MQLSCSELSENITYIMQELSVIATTTMYRIVRKPITILYWIVRKHYLCYVWNVGTIWPMLCAELCETTITTMREMRRNITYVLNWIDGNNKHYNVRICVNNITYHMRELCAITVTTMYRIVRNSMLENVLNWVKNSTYDMREMSEKYTTILSWIVRKMQSLQCVNWQKYHLCYVWNVGIISPTLCTELCVITVTTMREM